MNFCLTPQSNILLPFTIDYALNQLGLSTQVPLNVVYLTNGAARKIKIVNRTITF